MSQNLNIGDMINGMDNPANNVDIEKYCYDNQETNCDDLGGLYQWGEMMQYVTDESTQGICPDGFHLPSDDEWKVLEGNVDSRFGLGVAEWDKYAARGYDAAFRLKTTFGYISDGYGADTYGFHGFPSGYRSSVGTFSYLGSMAMYWTSSEYITDVGTSRELIYNYFKISRGSYADVFGLGVRCLKDE